MLKCISDFKDLDRTGDREAAKDPHNSKSSPKKISGPQSTLAPQATVASQKNMSLRSLKMLNSTHNNPKRIQNFESATSNSLQDIDTTAQSSDTIAICTSRTLLEYVIQCLSKEETSFSSSHDSQYINHEIIRLMFFILLSYTLNSKAFLKELVDKCNQIYDNDSVHSQKIFSEIKKKFARVA